MLVCSGGGAFTRQSAAFLVIIALAYGRGCINHGHVTEGTTIALPQACFRCGGVPPSQAYPSEVHQSPGLIAGEMAHLRELERSVLQVNLWYIEQVSM
jgi:hypothetical protein